jgi:hypothetical protein
MNTRTLPRWIVALAAALITSASTSAADRAAPDDPVQPPERRVEPGRRGPRDTRPLERWMALMEQRDPERHAELRRLQEEDPEAFRAALRDHLAAMRERHTPPRPRDRHPGADESPVRPRRVPPGSPHRSAVPDRSWTGDGWRSDPDADRLREVESRLRDIGARYRDDDDHGLRPQLRDTAMGLLAEAFRLRQTIHRRQLDRMEADIARLRAAIDANETNRETLLQQRLDRLFGSEAPPDAD